MFEQAGPGRGGRSEEFRFALRNEKKSEHNRKSPCKLVPCSLQSTGSRGFCLKPTDHLRPYPIGFQLSLYKEILDRGYAPGMDFRVAFGDAGIARCLLVAADECYLRVRRVACRAAPPT